jgi:hypothetical protein
VVLTVANSIVAKLIIDAWHALTVTSCLVDNFYALLGIVVGPLAFIVIDNL